MLKNFLLLALGCLPLLLFAQAETTPTDKAGLVRLNSSYSYGMLEHNQDLRKVDYFLDARESGALEAGNLYLGAALVAIADFQSSNTDSKFAYLMRHPTANNQIGKTVSEAVIHSMNFALTAPVNDWLAAYAEILYDPEQSFGAGTITTLTRNQLQLRKGFILVGNPAKVPVYLAIGKFDAPFGQTGSVSPFTNSTMWHAFGGLSFGAQVGFRKAGFHATLMLAQGGAQFRAMHVPVEGTNVPSRLNNFVGDVNYTLSLGENSSFRFGASYLKGSAYCQAFPVVHFQPCAEENPAFTFYGTLTFNDRLVLKGSFARTQDPWPGTANPNPPLDVFEAHEVSSLDAGVKYVVNPGEKVEHHLSAEFSNFVAGPDGAPWERQNQIVVGYNALLNRSCRLFVEVFNTQGYAPLNFISGGNNPDNMGETHSVRDASSFGIVIGGLVAL